MAGVNAGCIEYSEQAHDSLIILVPRGKKEVIEGYAAQNNESVNTLANRLLRVYVGMSEQEWKR